VFVGGDHGGHGLDPVFDRRGSGSHRFVAMFICRGYGSLDFIAVIVGSSNCGLNLGFMFVIGGLLCGNTPGLASCWQEAGNGDNEGDQQKAACLLKHTHTRIAI